MAEERAPDHPASDQLVPFEVRTVVVGCDGSAPSQRAISWAAGFAAAVEARLVVVHAIPLLERLPGGEVLIAEQVRDEVGRLARTTWSDVARAHGIEPDCVVEDGPPVLVLPRVAAREGADVVVVGARGRGGAPDFVLGSTSAAVTQTATVPVVVVPEAAGDAAAAAGQ